MTKNAARLRDVGVGLGILGILYLLSVDHFLLFHSLAEGFSIVIAFSVFILAWNARRYLDNDYLLFIGIAYLFVAGVDAIHTLAYKGMGVFQGDGANLPTQLWIVARYLESLSLLVAPIFLHRRLKPQLALIGYASIVLLLFGAIFVWGIFPDCYIEGVGLTPFKKVSEYLISLILLASLFLLYRNRGAFDRGVLQLLGGSILLTVGSEIAFTFYVSVYGFSNLVGHFFKIAAFYLVYRALIETGIKKPFALIYRDLQEARDRLEERVQQRTHQLHEANKMLGKANRAYRVLSDSNQTIVRATDESELLDRVCNILAEVGGYCLAWVGFAEQDEGRRVRPVAQAGYEEGYLDALDLVWSDTERGRGPTGTAIRTGSAYVARHILTDPNFEPWREEALKRGYASSVALPLMADGRALGALNIYAGEPDAFDADELALLRELANDLAYGISSLRTMRALAASEARYRGLFDGVPVGLYRTTPDGQIRDANRALVEMLGYPDLETLLAARVGDLYLDVDDRGQQQLLAAERDVVEGVEVRLRCYDDCAIWARDSFRVVRDEAGRVRYYEGTLEDVTERREAEEALRESEARLEAIFRAAPTGIGVASGRILIEGNEQLGEMLGYGYDELAGVDARVLYATEAEYDRVGREHYGQPHAGRLETMETRWQCKDGTAIDVLLNSAALEPGDLSAGVIFTALDITARKQMEADLKRHHHELASLLAVGKQLTRQLRLDELNETIVRSAVETVASAEAASLWRYEEGRDRLVVVAWAGHEDKAMAGLAMKPEESLVGKVYRTNRGRYVNDVANRSSFQPLGEPALDAVQSALCVPIRLDGRPVGVLCADSYTDSEAFDEGDLRVFQSLADQAAIAIQNARLYAELENYSSLLKQAVEEATDELTHTIERLEVILANSPDPILLLRRDGTIETANRASTRVFGYGKEELVGAPLSVLLDPASAGAMDDLSRRVVEEGEQGRLEALARRQEGTTFDVDVAMAPIQEGEAVVGLVCSLRDISVLKEVDRLKDEFLSIAAHELRTPLTTVEGFSEILLTRDVGPERMARYLGMINDQAVQLKHILDDLLDLSRLEAGRGLDLTLAAVEMEGVVEEVVETFADTNPSHQFEVSGLAAAPPVCGDRFRLSQVVRNLVSNAVKYSPEGGAIAVQAETAPGRLLQISVQDEGIGMTPEQQTHVFEKFYRAGPVATDISGTGLGLAISRLIVEQHGGRVWVESEPGAGSTFSFTVPLDEEGRGG
jgi:PAS domain S-box-containing protein